MLVVIPLIVFAVYFINSFLFFAVTVKDHSMAPAVPYGETVYFNKVSLGWPVPFRRNRPNNRLFSRFPPRGSIIAYESIYSTEAGILRQFFDIPLNILSLGLINLDPRRLSVKRVVGLPGDTVEIINRRVFINDAPLLLEMGENPRGSEKKILPGSISPRDNIKKIFVPSRYFFVLSENWDVLNDSRQHGLVPFYKVEGVLWD